MKELSGTALRVCFYTASGACVSSIGSEIGRSAPMPEENNVGKNIRVLRECFGETQLQLANILDLNSVGAISNYENGTRIPERPVLEKLALHYRTTVDELTKSDLSELSQISFENKQWQNVSDIVDKMLPIFKTDKAMENEAFRRAYKAQTKIIEFIKKPGCNKPRISDSPRLYEECLNICGAPAAANLAAWLLLQWHAISAPKVDLYGEHALMEIFVKINCRDIDMEDEDASRASVDLRGRAMELERQLLPLLRSLRAAGGEFTELAEYYTAMSYFSALVTRNLSEDAVCLIGGEMFEESCRQGNRFSLELRNLLSCFIMAE